MICKIKILKLTILLAAACCFSTNGDLQAQIILASDIASDSAYNSAPIDGKNGGFGFDAFTVRADAGSGFAGTFIGSSSAIDTSGESWGTFANGDSNAALVMYRGFAGNSLSSSGDTFKGSIQHRLVASGGTMGLVLRNGNSSANVGDFDTGSRFQYRFLGGGSNYEIIDGAGTFDTGIGFSNGGQNLTLTLTSANTYDLTIENVGGATTTFTGRTLDGTGSLDSVSLFNRTDSQDVFFNSLQLSSIPEPNSLMMMAVATVMISRRRRR